MSRALLTGRLLLLAAVIALAIVVLGNVASTLAVGRDLFGTDGRGFPTRDVLVLHLVTTGLPMFVLALCAERRWAMWGIAAAIMAGFWTYFVWQLRQDYLADFAGGANIGLGLVMLASPLLTLLVLAAAGLLLKRAAR